MYAFDFEGCLAFGIVEQSAVGEVVHRVDLLGHAVFLDQEIIFVEAEDLVAAGVGDDGVEQHKIDVDFFTEFARLLLRQRCGRSEK